MVCMYKILLRLRILLTVERVLDGPNVIKKQEKVRVVERGVDNTINIDGQY